MLRAVVALALIAGCKDHSAPPPAPAPAPAPAKDAVPKTTVPIVIDGDWEEPDWAQHAFRAQFRGDDGQLARPSSEIRLLHDDKDLLIALYAADQNIETRDKFDVSVGAVSLSADAAGHVTPAIPGVRAKVGFDEGTLDNPKDDDEEWVVEIAIPLATVGTGSQPVRAARCDVPKDGTERCGSWSGRVTLP